MERPLYPSKYMRITQGYNTGSHINSFAIDEAGKDTSISTLYAPFTGVVKKIYTQDANEVWFESAKPVEYPDGTIDHMTIMFAHSNNVDNLFVGKKVNKNAPLYTEGTKGNTTGNHCHIECGKGKFTGTGWYKNSSGNYSINNGKKPEDCLWIDDSITIINNNNYKFRKIPQEVITPTSPPSPTPNSPSPTEQPQEINPLPEINPPKLIFTCKKAGLYGLYLEKDDEVYLK